MYLMAVILKGSVKINILKNYVLRTISNRIMLQNVFRFDDTDFVWLFHASLSNKQCYSESSIFIVIINFSQLEIWFELLRILFFRNIRLGKTYGLAKMIEAKIFYIKQSFNVIYWVCPSSLLISYQIVTPQKMSHPFNTLFVAMNMSTFCFILMWNIFKFITNT